MPKTKYRFNPNTLSYEEARDGFWKKLLRWILYLSPSIVIGLVLTFFFSRQLATPKESRLKKELALSQQKIQELQADMEDVNAALDMLAKKDKDIYRLALYADEFPEEYRIMGTGGSDKYDYLEGYSSSELLIEASKQMDLIEQRINGQSISFQELLKLAKDKEKLLACIPAIQPVNNKDLKRMASGYGWRIDPIYKTSKMHTGMDFTADRGTEVYATGDATVAELERNNWGYGNCIVLDHGYGYKTRYAHLSKFNVKPGQKVKRGDLIGYVGSTGKSTGDHLHYEVEVKGEKVNPINYYHSDLSPEEYEKLLEMSEKSYKALD